MESGEGKKRMEASAGREHFLDSLRAVAITLVVAIHAASYTQVDTLPGFKPFQLLLGSIAVQTFFAADGYLFALRAHERDYLAGVRRSARRLLLPWLLFSLIYLLARGLFEYAGVLSERLVLGQSPVVWLRGLYESEIASQLYFLPALFLVRLCSPLIAPLRGSGRATALLALAGYLLLFALLRDPLLGLFGHGGDAQHGKDPLLHALWGAQFFLAGVVLARFREAAAARAALVVPIALAAGGYLLVLGIDISFARTLGALALMVLLFTLFERWLPARGALARFGGYTMEIYLLHSPVLIKAVALLAVGWAGSRSLPAFALVTLVTLLAAWWIGRWSRRLPFAAPFFGRSA